MSTVHKVIVSGDSISLSRKQGFSNRIVNLEQAAQITSITEDDRNHGVISLQDGSIRKIIKCNGVNPILFSADELDAASDWFANLAKEADFEFQILCITTETHSEKYIEDRVAPTMKTEFEYAQWWDDYHRKWFLRVSDLYFIPQRFFYVIVPSQKQSGRTKSAEEKQLKLLEDRVEFIIAKLNEFGLAPEPLNRAQARVLIQSRTNPATRELEVSEAIPEYESTSTLCLPRAYEKPFELQIAGSYTSTQFLTMLPSEVCFGWFWRWLTFQGFHTLSIHLRPGKPGANKKKRVAMTVAFSTWSESSEKLEAFRSKLRKNWSETGAIIDNGETWQLEGWLATLPLALNTVPLTHTVEPEIVGTMNPFVEEKCGSDSGCIFGFSENSNQPMLLDSFAAEAGEPNVALLCAQPDDMEFLLKLLISRNLGTGTKSILLEDLPSMQFYCTTLGADIAEAIDLTSSPPNEVFAGKQMQVYFAGSTSAQGSGANIEKLCQRAIEYVRENAEEKLILFVREFKPLLNTTSGRKLLKELATLRADNLSVYLGTSHIAEILKQPSVIGCLSEIKTKILMRERSEAALEALSKLNVNDAEIAALAVKKAPNHGARLALLNTAKRKAVAWIISSPMENWLFADSYASRAKLQTMVDEIKHKNPTINQTDCQRQAVYYLALEA